MNKIILKIKNEYFMLGALIAVISFVNILWIIKDNRPQAFFDPYPKNTLEFVDSLKEQGFTQIPSLITKMSVGSRPPLYQLLAVPSIYLFGRSEDTILVVNIFFGVVLMLSTYGIAKMAKNSEAGLLASLLVATYPPIVGLSKIARPHSVLPACVALSLWLLFKLLKKRSWKTSWAFGASLGFGILIHPVFFFLLAAPSLIFCLYIALFQMEPRLPHSPGKLPSWLMYKILDPFVLKGLLPAGVIALAITAVWYLPNIDGVIYSAQVTKGFWSSVTLGFWHLNSSFWWYALTMPGAISHVLFALLVVGLMVNFSKKQPYRFVLALTFLLMYCSLSLSFASKGWLYAAAMLPVAAVISAIFIVDMRDFALAEWVLPFVKSGYSFPRQIYKFTNLIYSPSQNAFMLF